ncbi:MAG: SGNH/GDSL hydrolase family protein, partial [Actinobacteria bacterium]|nr:SGNH/GDSL hydrolase family protein [Actinomycetota bacterium]
VCLVLLEIGFRVAGYEPIYRAYSKPELFWRHDPLLGWSQQPGARDTFVGPRPFPVQFRTPVRINSIGLRGGEVSPVPAGGKRVLVLGDSFVAGFEVAEDKTYAALLEGQLTEALGVPVQVVNGGVRGYGTDQSYLYYSEHGRHLRPDLVLLHETRNDPEDNTTLHRMRRPFGKPAFSPRADGSLSLVGRPVPRYSQCSAYRLDERFRVRRLDTPRTRTFCWLQTRLADHSAFLSFVTSRIQRNPALVHRIYNLGTPEQGARPASPPSPEPSVPPAPPVGLSDTPAPASAPAPAADHAHRLTSMLIRRLAATTAEDGVPMVLLAGDDELPMLDEAGFVADGIEVVRVDEAQRPPPGSTADPRAFRDAAHFSDGHLNPVGHRRVADFLAPRVARRLAEAGQA